jgi:hypothetical protein
MGFILFTLFSSSALVILFFIYPPFSKNTTTFISKKSKYQDFRITKFTVDKPNTHSMPFGDYFYVDIKRIFMFVSFYTPYYSPYHDFFSNKSTCYKTKVFDTEEQAQNAINELTQRINN